MTLSTWAATEGSAGGWIRRMFTEGERLKREFGADTVADLSIGQPLEVTEPVREAIVRAAREDFPGRFSYMPNRGYDELRERCAEDVGFPGTSVDSVTVTAGAAGAITLALRTFVDPGDQVIAVEPYFPEFRLYASVHGAPFATVPTRDDLTIDIEALERLLAVRTGALIINSPCNPSGHLTSDAELQDIATCLEGHNRRHGRPALLIVDEVYHRLIFDGRHRAEPFEYYADTVMARSFSKDLGLAGERIGYLAVHPSLASPDCARALETGMRALGFVNAPATAQRALLQLSSWHVEITPYAAKRALALDALAEAGIDAHPPDGGLYVWARSPWHDTIAFVEALAAQRVLVTPGIAFGVEDHIRICFTASGAAWDVARAALREVAASTTASG